ncbi:MAG: hypothetical protein AAF652_03620 [Cyanobacteria bacterium P01_C01_bin.72]
MLFINSPITIAKQIKTIITFSSNDVIQPINAQNLRDIHQRLEKRRTIGKIALADWN